MDIKRYEIVPDVIPGRFRVVDKLKDDFVCIPLTCNSKDELLDIMGKDMDEVVDSTRVHPGYLGEEMGE